MNILIAGEGGQGIQLIAELLAKAAFLELKPSLYIPNFGVEQRGGISLGFVVIDEKEVVYPKFDHARILAILCDRAIPRVESYIDKNTFIILGPAVKQVRYAKFPVKNKILVKASWFPPKVWNILVLAEILKHLKIISKSTIISAMEEKLKNKFIKDPQLKELDIRALG